MSLYTLIDKEVMMRDGFTQSVIDSSEPPKKWSIPKKNGGYRSIHHPSSKNKLLQYWLLTKVFDKLPQHDASYAFVKNRSIKDNALRHAKEKNNYYVKLDIKDFFPSIEFSDFEKCFLRYRELISIPTTWDESLLFLIKETCFLKPQKNLPVGFPSSPAIANFVARELDELILGELASYEKYNPIYTRYADDLVISVAEKGLSKEIIKAVKKAIKNCTCNFSLNEQKIKICSASGGSIIATGLKICNDHHLTLHKKMKDSIRLKLSLYSKGKLNIDELNKLSGYIAFAKSIDEHFYTKLNRKFFKELSSLENVHLKE
ncbi:retron St85 family RNA-directed DNA polymerase [Candidatus Pantoea floridensis]|uniref:RNA-directed DNA polymerase n=1 Tax=Candidatus Pantoea floridensis TaxID=1938870 RepID=A0A286BYP3_9GAMM|nr:retron St85 family RNA-directed DNA polymerase [Pantoea floridensis]PIF21761.1 reverse transcriptase (RNA-dependent DNA polymerase) [Enterobacteriaceae bacterium JKS000233]SOD39271.1 Reverse transcriptase (RNA-dependent DNA polymerase) [Pantoea floridensis]